jgi:small subunit ribosomal protein S2
MKPYIFTERNGIHIIDLQKTSKALDQAYTIVRDAVAEGGTVLFIGTKRQAQETVQLEATRSSMPYVTNRWLGGMLTNWRTIRQRINELERLERMRDTGDFGRHTKKEALIMSREIERLEGLLSGVRKMARVPELVFVVDISREATAIHEANLLNIPVVAMVDTNCDPRGIDYVIPSNDDAIRAIKLVVGKIADAAIEGLGSRKDEVIEEEVRTVARAAADERELTDEELLGESTLAKIAPYLKAIDEEAIEEVLVEEELKEEVEELGSSDFELDEEELEEFEEDKVEAEDLVGEEAEVDLEGIVDEAGTADEEDKVDEEDKAGEEDS